MGSTTPHRERNKFKCDKPSRWVPALRRQPGIKARFLAGRHRESKIPAQLQFHEEDNLAAVIGEVFRKRGRSPSSLKPYNLGWKRSCKVSSSWSSKMHHACLTVDSNKRTNSPRGI